MKRGKKLLLLLLALTVVSAGAWITTRLNAEDTTAATEDSGQVIFALDTASVTSLSWTHKAESLSFTYADGWTYTADDSFPLDKSYLETMLSELKEVVANKVIEEPGDLEQFGLETPVCTVTVNGTAVLSLGNESTMGGQVYLSTGDSKVYLADSSLLDAFDYGLLDLAVAEDIPDLTEISALKLVTETETLDLFYSENSGLAYSNHYAWFRSQDNRPVDMEAMEGLLSDISSLAWEGCAAWLSETEDLAVYGLDTPAATYELHHPEGVFTVELGDAADSDSCYARVSGSKLIYLITADLSSALINVTGDHLLPDDVLKLNLDTVDSVQINLDGKTYTVEKTTVSATDSDGNVTTQTLWTLNGEAIGIEAILEDLMDMTGEIPEGSVSSDGAIELQLLFDRNTATYAQIALCFWQHNGTHCRVTLNGETTLLAARTDVVAIIEAINALVL